MLSCSKSGIFENKDEFLYYSDELALCINMTIIAAWRIDFNRPITVSQWQKAKEIMYWK